MAGMTKLTYDKKIKLKDLKYGPSTVQGEINETYTLNGDTIDEVYQQSRVHQVRPAFMKAVSMIEARTLR